MTNWEHKIVKAVSEGELSSTLDRLGSEGWELVAANLLAGAPEHVGLVGGRPVYNPSPHLWIAVLKRPMA
jgi:hypothetical protein